MADFLGKSSVEVNNPAVNGAVQNLGADLLNMFGGVGKAAETYNTIGATAAKLEYQQDSLEVTTKLGDIRTQLVEAKMRNDTETIGNLNAQVDTVTAELASRADKFKNHTAAYDIYSGLANDFSATTRAAYKPLIAEAYLTSVRVNQDVTNTIQREKQATTGIPLTDQDTKLRTDLDLANGVPIDKTAHEDFKTNHSMFSADVTKNIGEISSHYQLLKVNPETQETVYDYNAESDMVKAVYGGRYFIDKKTGFVETTSEFATTEEMDMVSTVVQQLRKTLTADDGSAGSAEFDAIMKQVEAELKAYSENTTNDTEYTQKAMNFDTRLLSKSQKHRVEVLKHEIRFTEAQAVSIRTEVDALLKDSDATGIATAKANGTSTNSGADITKEVNRRIANINTVTMQAFLANSDKLPQLLNNARKEMLVLGGGKLEAISRAEAIATGTEQSTSVNSTLSSIAIVREGIQSGVGIDGNMFSSNLESAYKLKQLDINHVAITEYQAGLKKQGLKPNEIETKTKSFINGLNAKGASDIATNIKNNAIWVATADMKKTDGYMNLGTSVQLTQSQKNFVAQSAANSGVVLGSEADVLDYVDNNMMRISNFWGKAQHVPNVVSDKGFEAIQADALRKLGYKVNDNTLKYNITIVPSYGKDGNTIWGSVIVTPPKGKPMYLSDPLNLSELDKLVPPSEVVAPPKAPVYYGKPLSAEKAKQIKALEANLKPKGTSGKIPTDAKGKPLPLPPLSDFERMDARLRKGK